MDCIVELRAGLMALQGGRLTADSRKGLLRVCQVRQNVMISAEPSCSRASRAKPSRRQLPPRCLSPQDDAGLTHLCWCERDAAGAAVGGEPEKDIVIIPGECTFGKVRDPHPAPADGCWCLVGSVARRRALPGLLSSSSLQRLLPALPRPFFKPPPG